MKKKYKKLIGFGLLVVALFVFLKQNNEIDHPAPYYDYFIFVQTTGMLLDEFGVQAHPDDFDLLNNPDNSIRITENKWKLQGTPINGAAVPPWSAQVLWEPEELEVVLLWAGLNGKQIFPTKSRSNLVFETKYKLNLATPELPSR